MTKLGRMALYEAPRVSQEGRLYVDVRLRAKGVRRAPGAMFWTIKVPRMNPMPEVITYEGHIFVRKLDDLYTEANIWPALKELDG